MSWRLPRRTFTRAAEQCLVVQSALSHQVKTLKRELSVALFARTSRRVALTAAGKAFLPWTRVSLEALKRVAAQAVATIGQVRGTLTIGLIPTVTAIDIPATLGQFHWAHPGVRISIRSRASDDLTAGLRSSEVDIAFFGLPQGTPHAHLHWRELARERLAFDTADLRREVTFEAMSTSPIPELIEQGLAIALLPPAFIPPAPTLVAVPVTDGPVRGECLAWSGFNPSPVTTAFLTALNCP